LRAARDIINCCTSSVRLYRASDSREIGKNRNLLIYWKHSAGQDKVGREQISGLQVKGQGHCGNKKRKVVFRAYFRQKWIDLRQTETRMINGHSTHIVEYISPAEMLRFVIICDL